jgi:glycosyltransferase involved in cell wall biosynthesis
MDRFDRACVLIPTINETTLPEVVKAVQSQAPSIEIHILGFGSAADVARAHGVQFFDLTQRTNKSIAINKVMETIEKDWLIILDADAIPQPGWADHMLREFENGRQIFSGSVDIRDGNLWMKVYNLSFFHEFLPEKSASNRKYLPAISLGYTRDFFRRNGQFSEELNRSEDFEWTLRAYQKKETPYFTPQPVIKHLPINKNTFTSLIEYWFNSAHDNWTVRRQYRHLLRLPFFMDSPLFILLFSPLLAVIPTIRIFSSSPKVFLKNIHLIPLVYLTKLVWCFGVFRGAVNLFREGNKIG